MLQFSEEQIQSKIEEIKKDISKAEKSRAKLAPILAATVAMDPVLLSMFPSANTFNRSLAMTDEQLRARAIKLLLLEERQEHNASIEAKRLAKKNKKLLRKKI